MPSTKQNKALSANWVFVLREERWLSQDTHPGNLCVLAEGRWLRQEASDRTLTLSWGAIWSGFTKSREVSSNSAASPPTPAAEHHYSSKHLPFITFSFVSLSFEILANSRRERDVAGSEEQALSWRFMSLRALGQPQQVLTERNVKRWHCVKRQEPHGM